MISMAEKIEKLDELLAKGRSGRRPMGLGVSLLCPSIIEMAGEFGFDYVIVDQEHTLVQGAQSVAEMLRAAELSGLPAFVKLNEKQPSLIRDAFDAGAYGVIVPFIESAAELRQMLEWTRFPPVGTRGTCSLARVTRYSTGYYTKAGDLSAEFADFVNNHGLVIPTIESIPGVENIDEILSVPDVPIIHVGTEDLMASLATEGHTDPAYTVRVARTLSTKMKQAKTMLMWFMSLHNGQERAAEAIDILGVEMPYVAETHCFSFGAISSLATVEMSMARPVPGEEVQPPTQVAK